MAKKSTEETAQEYLERLRFKKDVWMKFYGGDIQMDVPNRFGCYVVYIKGEVVYVGQSNQVSKRLNTHRLNLFNN